MYNHAPAEYDCPFCRLAGGLSTGLSGPEDVVYVGSLVTAFLSIHWFPNNPGHVLVVPNQHFENIYDLPTEIATEVHRVSREVAIAFKRLYGCHGVSIRQNNEPAGDQDVWHYHLHVVPRYEGDDLDRRLWRRTTPDERRPFSAMLRDYFSGEKI